VAVPLASPKRSLWERLMESCPGCGSYLGTSHLAEPVVLASCEKCGWRETPFVQAARTSPKGAE
jgi:hypothetical protein